MFYYDRIDVSEWNDDGNKTDESNVLFVMILLS